jgi:hypothetical protein
MIARLKAEGMNPYVDGPFDAKIGEIQDYNEFIRLGGVEEYVRLGCPQNKEITLDNRVKMMKRKQLLV